MAAPAARVLPLQRAIGNRAVGQMLARSAPPAPPPPKIGPAKDIPEDRGDVERGYFATTSKVTYKEKCAKYGWSPILGNDREPNTGKKDEYYARINRW